MMGTSCVFILTKSSDFPCIISLFLNIFDYAVIDSRYWEASGYVGGFDLGDA
jgi:hypothetical protein